MKLPSGESHHANNWLLEEKRQIEGKGWFNQDVVTNYTNFKCSKCLQSYIRFIYDEEEFENLEVGFSKWEWEWDKTK